MKGLYFRNRFFRAVAAIAGLFLLAYSLPPLLNISRLLFFLLPAFLVLDVFALFRFGKPFFARRLLPERLSNGMENEVPVYLENRYPFPVRIEVIDELPFQFQARDQLLKARLRSGETKTISYSLRPVRRGEYDFGTLNVYVSGRLGLVQRRFRFEEGEKVAVYPAFRQMRRYELLTISNRLAEAGIRKVRRIGQSLEFEQVRNYVTGDDPRMINWQATARKNDLMVNAFQEEKSQQVYCVIDKGRVMQLPFGGLSLLDHAINASLVLAGTVLLKGDKAGLITFSDRMGQLVPAGKRRSQLNTILETLYKQRTRYLESDYERLYASVRQKVTQRSLLVLFTNFGTVSGMYRQLPYLQGLAKRHLLLVVFFEDTELRSLTGSRPSTTGDIFLKTVAEKFSYEKRLVVKALGEHGIQAILTPPADLTVNTVNKYLELKARRLI